MNYISYHVHQERISYTRDSKNMLLPNGIFLCELLLRFVSYCKKQYIGLGLVMVFNAIFNNVPFISRRSVLLVEETG